MTNEQPYIITNHDVTVTTREYNPNFGDNRLCVCGHPYHRHFDSYDDMRAIGCKYCECGMWREPEVNSKTPETNEIIAYINEQFPATIGHKPLREMIGKLETDANETSDAFVRMMGATYFKVGDDNHYVDMEFYDGHFHIKDKL